MAAKGKVLTQLIGPEDIFVKDSLFEKCIELVKLEFNGSDFEDDEDFILLLKKGIL